MVKGGVIEGVIDNLRILLTPPQSEILYSFMRIKSQEGNRDKSPFIIKETIFYRKRRYC
jgi:hypothetical protein